MSDTPHRAEQAADGTEAMQATDDAGAGQTADGTDAKQAAHGAEAGRTAHGTEAERANDGAEAGQATDSPAPLTSLTPLLGGSFEGGSACAADGTCD